MKPIVLGLLFLAELLLLHLIVLACSASSCASARPLRLETNDQATIGKEVLLIGRSNVNMMKHHRATTLVHVEADDFSDVLGEMEEEEEEEEEGCGREEGSKEECTKRRLMADAHLDYIYTQRHSHP